MIELGLLFAVLIGGYLGLAVTRAFFSHRYWRRVIAEGDLAALHAALLEALETWRRMRPPQDVIPSDWRALQSAEVVAADTARCRVSLLAEPDIRVVDGVRSEVGPAADVAQRAAVTMVERLLYEIPLCRFDAVQVDVYAQYRSPGGEVTSECLLTTQLDRARAVATDWDELDAAAILDTWTTRELRPGGVVDPARGALIEPVSEPPAVPHSANGSSPHAYAEREP